MVDEDILLTFFLVMDGVVDKDVEWFFKSSSSSSCFFPLNGGSFKVVEG